ncbi:MAG: hypothetical protein SFV15_19705 [Polyangiaceae bacterium]|nr:hypothetical protein [Polyangiaceae bacterium]
MKNRKCTPNSTTQGGVSRPDETSPQPTVLARNMSRQLGSTMLTTALVKDAPVPSTRGAGWGAALLAAGTGVFSLVLSRAGAWDARVQRFRRRNGRFRRF